MCCKVIIFLYLMHPTVCPQEIPSHHYLWNIPQHRGSPQSPLIASSTMRRSRPLHARNGHRACYHSNFHYICTVILSMEIIDPTPAFRFQCEFYRRHQRYSGSLFLRRPSEPKPSWLIWDQGKVIPLSHRTHFSEPSIHQGVTFSQWSCNVFDR